MTSSVFGHIANYFEDYDKVGERLTAKRVNGFIVIFSLVGT